MASKPTFQLIAIVVTGLVLTVFPAVMHGRYTNRWGPSPDLTEAADQLKQLPREFGEWELVSETNDMPKSVLRELSVVGYWNRIYRHASTGQQVTVLLMAGTPGALSRHPPEICYASRANERIGNPTAVSVTDAQQQTHEFRLLRFKRTGGIEDRFFVCYGFTNDGTWSNPEYPRIEFGGGHLLYKMQVLSEIAEPESRELPTAASLFLTDFLPTFEEACSVP